MSYLFRVLGPGVVREEVLDLLVRGQLAGDELPRPGREGQRADGPRDEEGVDEPVPLQHGLDPLVTAQPQHVPVRFDKLEA